MQRHSKSRGDGPLVAIRSGFSVQHNFSGHCVMATISGMDLKSQVYYECFLFFGEIKISEGKQVNYLQLTPITCCRCMFVGFFFKKITPLAILGASSESKKWKQLNYTD